MGGGQQTVEQFQPVGLMLGVGQGLGTGGVGQFDETIVGAAIGQAGGVHWLGQPEPAVEADIHAEGIPALQAHLTTAHDRMFVVMVKVKAFALFEHGGQPAALAGAAHGHGQAGFDSPKDGDEAGAHAVPPGDIFDEILLAGLGRTQEVVRSAGGGGEVLGLLKQTVSQPLGMLGEVHPADFGGTEISVHPLRRKERTEAGVEAEAIPTAQSALDQRAKLVDKALGNEVFRQKVFLHKDTSTTRRPRSHSLVFCPQTTATHFSYSTAWQSRSQSQTADRRATDEQVCRKAVWFWLRLCHAVPYRRIEFCGVSPRPSGLEFAGILPTANWRYGSLKISATSTGFM